MSDFKKLTGEELISLIEDNFEDQNEFVEEYGYGDTNYEPIFGKSEIVEEEGGHEGAGEDCHIVRYFSDHDVYIRLDGWYASYDGTHWEDADYRVVKAVYKMVRFYE